MQLLSRLLVGSFLLVGVLCLGTLVSAQDNGQSNGTTTKVVSEQYPDLVELDPFGGVSIWGQVNKGLGEKLVDGGTAGGRIAINVTKRVGIELGYNFMVNNVRLVSPIAPGVPSFNFGNQIQSVALNPVFNLRPRGSRVQPYVTVGAGIIQFNPTKKATDYAKLPSTIATYLNSDTLSSSRGWAVNYGGGVKFHISPHFGLRFDVRGLFARNPTFNLPSFSNGGIFIPASNHMNGLQATFGFVYYIGSGHMTVTVPAPPKTIPSINAGELTGGEGQLCQGKAITVHSTATDPAGHALKYAWKSNGIPAGSDSPDFSFTPNNAGDFKIEVAITDATDPSRTVTAGPKTITVQDYTPPQISTVTASPNSLSCAADTAGAHTATLAAQVTGSACGGNLTYKWTVTEGTVTNDSSPNATFDSSSLNFDAGGGQKAITATLTATDEQGKAVSQTTTINVTCPAVFKRLPDVVFAKNSARVNNCGKRILIEQAAPQAGTAYDILLVSHRSADEVQKPPSSRRRASANRSLDEQRAMNAAAVLTGDHGTCANLDPSQIKIDIAGTDQTSTPDPGICGTSNLPQTKERKGSQVTDADKERRVEVYLVPKGSQTLPPAAKNAQPVSESAVKALGCPK